jgi:hypothetical protein
MVFFVGWELENVAKVVVIDVMKAVVISRIGAVEEIADMGMPEDRFSKFEMEAESFGTDTSEEIGLILNTDSDCVLRRTDDDSNGSRVADGGPITGVDE